MEAGGTIANDQPGAEARTGRLVLVLLGIWLLTAVAVGVSGAFQRVPAQMVGLTNAVLIALCLVGLYAVPSLRAWVTSTSLRPLVLFHVVRFVGIVFLVLHAAGEIPGEFAIKAGWGDIAIAVTAPIVAYAALPVSSQKRWTAALAWNVFGLAEIIIVLGTGNRLGFANYEQMAWITEFPLSLLPTFLVPLIVVTHLVMIQRLRKMLKDPDGLFLGDQAAA
ncbi:MAG: hypothetical protein ACI80V_001233 [Rhodothermales bacterium]